MAVYFSGVSRCPIDHRTHVVDVKRKHAAVVQVMAVLDVVFGHDGRRVILDAGVFLDLGSLNDDGTAVNCCCTARKRHLFKKNDFLA